MGREHIVVVDDEEDILELVRYNLTKEGYKVTCATTGEKGLELARAGDADLVLLDLMLPGIHGLDVCKLLKQDSATSHKPVVIISARGEESDACQTWKDSPQPQRPFSFGLENVNPDWNLSSW